MVRGNFNGVGGLVCAEGKSLEGRWRRLSRGVAEALDSGHLGLLDTLELVALGCVDRHRDCLAGSDLLKVICIKTVLLVVDVNSFEGESLSL